MSSRFSPGCKCCLTRACCNCTAQPVFWSFSWPGISDGGSGFTSCNNSAPAGDYVLEMVNCSTNVNPEAFANHTRWESEEGFTYNGGASFQPYFVLTCGKPTEAEGGTDRMYRLLVYGDTLPGTQVTGFYLEVIADTPSEEECLGPLSGSPPSSSFCAGFPDPLVLTGVL